MKDNYADELINMKLPTNDLAGVNILVTGANGLIASNLVEALVFLNEKQNFHMNVYALCRTQSKAENRFKDLFDKRSFHLIIQDVIEPLNSDIPFDYVIHAASPAHPGAFNTVPVDVMKANFIGTLNLLEYCRLYQREGRKPRFMYVSSSEVYGENFENVEFFTENMNGSVNPDNFRSCYPESKRAAETLCECYKKQYNLDVVIVRPAFIYGKEILEDNIRADAYFLRQVLNHENIVMYSKGDQIRSYLYINDCVSAMLFVLLKGKNGEVYNIGNDENEISLHDYAQMLCDLGGVELIYEPNSEPDGVKFLKTTRMILKADKLKSLGWKANYGLKDGIKDILSK